MPHDSKSDILPVVEETVSLSKRSVPTGRVRIATETETIEHLLSAELSQMEVEVGRVPVDRRMDAVPKDTTKGS
ncbi:DUF2382 domain-containing protein [Paracoccus benzoatiresistens]|uniref:DUF2382 domain-containing protein n=1 Tax=Paracoccus benzoatiresistens TaxID=2997341 RepID=A0ABT4J7Y1_9RHOB|nr:DUF2382 domain-containing protein [Paracoccus sp. EF6]MCZ0963235.1 DUF2382 domain-containing protein [Paracoccus sp. EF6]